MAKEKKTYKLTKLSDIREYDKNPRVISQQAVDAVAKSIVSFGFTAPIIVDKKGVIIGGHTRYKAAKQLGLDTVPVLWCSDMTDLQVKGYRIADNKTAELAGWDYSQLALEVEELAQDSSGLVDSLAMSEWELDDLINSAATLPKDARKEAVSKPNAQASDPIEQPENTQVKEPENIDTSPIKQVQETDETVRLIIEFDNREQLDDFLSRAGLSAGRTFFKFSELKGVL